MTPRADSAHNRVVNLANRITVFFSAVLVLSGMNSLYAQNGATRSFAAESIRTVRLDVEVDPTPYFEHGYSFHVGIGWSHVRIEGEVLGTDVPEWIRGNRDFEVSYHGEGTKFQYFFSQKQKGAFVGARSEITRESVKLRDNGLEKNPMRHDLGLDAGYRFRVGQHWYVAPWGGVDYTFDAHNLELAGRTYKDARLGVFAAVHFGWRF